jgi:hypothetical protein
MTAPATNNSPAGRRQIERWYRRGTVIAVVVCVIAVIAFNVASPHPILRNPPLGSPIPGLVHDFDASNRQAFDRDVSDDQGSVRAWDDCSTINPTGRASRFDASHSADHEYIATLTGARKDVPSKVQSCTVWVYWNYQHGWTVDALPLAVKVPNSSGGLSFVQAKPNKWEESLIVPIVSTFDRNEPDDYINLFDHDDFSNYAWDACSVISSKNRTIGIAASHGRGEIFVSITGRNKKHLNDPQACTFWLQNDAADDLGWQIDGINGAFVRTHEG